MGFKRLVYLYALKFLMFRKTLWFVLFLLMAVSCLDEPDCYQLNNNIIGISIKNFKTFAKDTINVTSIKAIGSDSVFYQGASGNNLDKIYLPLNFYRDSTLFLFDRHGTIDSLWLGYKARAQFVSTDCGERFVLSDLGVIKHSFDSVRLISRTPTKNNTGNHLEIFK